MIPLGPFMLFQVAKFHFLLLSNILLYTHTTFVCSSIDGHLGCFILAIVNIAARNIGLHISFLISALLSSLAMGFQNRHSASECQFASQLPLIHTIFSIFSGIE